MLTSNLNLDLSQLADDDPQAPWIVDNLYCGMSPASARKSWETAQERELDTRREIARIEAEEPPVAASLDEYGLTGASTDSTEKDTSRASLTIAAKPYVWRDPETLPRRQWLFGRHLIRGFCSATVAPGGVGKTSLSIAEALCMVSAQALLGPAPTSEPLRVWLWNLEDPDDELQRRIQAGCLHHKLTAENLADRLYLNDRESSLVIARATPSGAVVIEPVVDALIAEIKTRGIDVLVIDPFVSCHQVSENDNSAVDAVVKAWGRVAGGGNCAVELVHHARKMGDAEVTAESARGAVAMVAGCRDVRVLNRMTKEEAERTGLENARLFFRVESAKQNMAAPADRCDWFQLVGVDLGNGPPGSSDWAQTAVRWIWPDATDGLTAGDLFAVQKAVAAGDWRADPQAKNWAGQAVANVLDLDAASPEGRQQVKGLLKMWLASGALKTVKRPDEKRRPKRFVEVGEWAATP